jgi:hypothetical protein
MHSSKNMEKGDEALGGALECEHHGDPGARCHQTSQVLKTHLEGVRCYFVRQTNATALLLQVYHKPRFMVPNIAQCKLKLLRTVTLHGS